MILAQGTMPSMYINDNWICIFARYQYFPIIDGLQYFSPVWLSGSVGFDFQGGCTRLLKNSEFSDDCAVPTLQ